MIFIVLGIAYIVIVVSIVLWSSTDSHLLVQLSREDEIQRLGEYLKQNGIPTFAKNLYAQGLIVRRGGKLGDPSLHVINRRDLPRARQLVSTLGYGKQAFR